MDEQMMREKLLSLKYHHQASHVPPDHRDQHNREIDEIIAALSQPAAQGDSSHSAGGECGGVPDGWQLVPIIPTPAMIAAATVAVLPDASKEDFELAREAAKIVLAHPNAPPDASLEAIAAAMATIIPAHKAMLSAATRFGTDAIQPITEEARIERALTSLVACGETVEWYLEQAFSGDDPTVRKIMVREIVRVILANPEGV